MKFSIKKTFASVGIALVSLFPMLPVFAGTQATSTVTITDGSLIVPATVSSSLEATPLVAGTDWLVAVVTNEDVATSLADAINLNWTNFTATASGATVTVTAVALGSLGNGLTFYSSTNSGGWDIGLVGSPNTLAGGLDDTIDYSASLTAIGGSAGSASTFMISLFVGVLGSVMVAGAVLRGLSAVGRRFGILRAKV